MADPNIQNILAALAAQNQGGTPAQSAAPPLPNPQYPPPQYASPPGSAPPYALPQPISSGSVDLGGIKPINSGSVSIADALAKAKGFAAEKGIQYDPRSMSRNDGRREYRRSQSPTPRDSYGRDSYNPYRDERRSENERFDRQRSLSPRREYGSPTGYRDRSPGRGGQAGEPDSELMPIEKSMVGLIIGRGGENLRRVEQQTSARVQFVDGPETQGTMRHCRISGSRAARASAKAEIYKIMEDNELAKRGQDKSRTQVASVEAMGEITQERDSLQMMVPDRTVGLIIGRGGETIRDLQERSGCHVNIVGENKSVNGYRPVNLIGSASSQARAKDLILEIVESDQKGISVKDLHSRRNDDAYGKMNDSITVPGDAVGMIIGKGGETIRQMQDRTGCKINVSQPTGRDIEREIGLIGTRGAIEAAKRAIREKVDTVASRGQSQPPNNSSTNAYAAYGDAPPSYDTGGIPPTAASGAAGQPGAGGDPYAAYGGYDNYVKMWYAAIAAQQQQQGGQGQGEPR